ncbi:MAG: glycogen-binding domain-containing protein [Elusimicrobia bacterium]|nr:glycogen-binding domain-containing protein [Elusimicrobiota bacterium]
MDDRLGRGKWAFWLFVAALAALTAVPSASLLRAARAYYRFLTGAAPDTIRPSHPRSLDLGRPAEAMPDRDLRLAEFRLGAPKAGQVEIVGDFCGWKPAGLRLSRGAGGTWEIMLPLPPGSYRYEFIVDGQNRPDPRAPVAAGPDGRKVSERKVR